jgi:uncharacterized membrane protein YdbT with pleckstrin-like domain
MASTDDAPVPDAPVLPLKDEGPAASASPIFQGPPSLWLGFRSLFLSGVLMLAAMIALFFGLTMDPGFFKTVIIVCGVALLLACSLMDGYVVLSIRTLRYTITTRLIEREEGIVIKRVDSLDLFRVKDVQLSQSLVQRALNVGTIKVFSGDKSDPVMLIEDIPNARPAYEKLRDAVMTIAQKRSVVTT